MHTITDIEAAFDAALGQVRRAMAAGLMTLKGTPAREQLEQLEFRLQAERAKAIQRGSVDIDWVQKTIRWTVEWTPESDITIIAALGRIARLASPGLS
jgi:hypothetical protein